jgi:ActR/RegA family two-component response regulator
MMMAHDPGPAPAILATQTIEAVRVAMVQYISAPSQSDDLRDALHRMAADAREKTVLPEQLLIVLKDVWYELPGVQAMSDTTEQVHLLQRVVTMCIREYYAD